MKHKTLLALGIAGALACGSSTAATFLCTQESGGTTVSCAEIPAEVLGSITSSEDAWTLSPPSVTYYLVPLDQDQVALLELSEPSDAESPAVSGSSDISSADQWQHSEPRSMTYNSSAEFDAMNPSGQ